MNDASAGAEIVPVICGPTAAGKSELALRLAESSGRSILVADSRQVYRGFDIGTAKPNAEEQRRVAHFGVDLVEPTHRFSAAQWANHARGVLGRGERPIIVGGTGLYLRALFDGLFTEPELDPERRRALLVWLETQSTDRLREWTTVLDPHRAHLGRTQLLRAIEIALLTGQRITTHYTQPSPLIPRPSTLDRWAPAYLVIDPGPSLQQRIVDRFDAMVAAGWLEEVEGLAAVPDDAPAWKASGYRALRDVVRGRCTLAEARARGIIETRQYAKRQRTWFRHQLPPERTTRVDPSIDAAADDVQRWWQSVTNA